VAGKPIIQHQIEALVSAGIADIIIVVGYKMDRIISFVEKIQGPKRDFLFLDDMTEALIAAGKYVPATIETFNIGYGKSYSVKEIVKMVIDKSGRSVKVKYLGKKRKGEVLDVVADITKARKLLKWKPQVSFSKGLSKLI
jgi:nucleoside-diphosphate-sugar epimerase